MLERSIKWIMIIVGVLTCTMVMTAFAPHQGMVNMFGESLEGNVANIVVRSWAMLITITGGLLIYGALRPAHRKLVMIAACVSKSWFVYLNLSMGQAYLASTMPAIVLDSVAVLLFIVYLGTSKSQQEA